MAWNYWSVYCFDSRDLEKAGGNWRNLKTPCGMNDLLYLKKRRPYARDMGDIYTRLRPGYIAVLFDKGDTPREMYRI